jgi:hypothetical protein
MKSPTPTAQPVALASIGVVTDGQFLVPDPITVHFNPVSLQLQVSATNPNQTSGGGKATQSSGETTSKLTMDLIFDTTDTGEDVSLETRKLQAFVKPVASASKQNTDKPAPPLVLFEWGTLRFRGIMDSYKETIDFFSANGVPLRSSVNLTLSQQDGTFEAASDQAPTNAGTVDDDLFDTPSANASDVANAAGVPSAARALAAANGQESLRFGAGAGLTVGGSIELKPPVAFASAGAGISLGAGAGVGLGVSAGAGLSLGASASFGVGASAGGSTSAGIAGLASLSASEGAFAGLRVTTGSSVSYRIDASRLTPTIGSTTVATDAGATFKIGGKASFQGAAGLRADVGASGKLSFDAK